MAIHMKILAIDTSAGPASCAVTADGDILASALVNVRLTHSQTLMPMVEGMLRHASLSLSDMDALAVAVGPGSFTGVRIGVAAVKGLAFANNTPCVAVSTLEAIAQNAAGSGFTGLVCAAMDARCGQVYTATFVSDGEKVDRFTDDEAITITELTARLSADGRPVMLMGDGAAICYAAMCETLPDVRLAPPHLRYQQATGVAAAALPRVLAGETVTAKELLPVYLRLPQAERELRARQGLPTQP